MLAQHEITDSMIIIAPLAFETYAFAGDAPPTILYTLVSGSASVEPTGELFVYPDSVLRLDCITARAMGEPDWSWTQALGQHSAGK